MGQLVRRGLGYSLAARKLKPGRYTVTLTVRDACGRVSSRKTLRFTATI